MAGGNIHFDADGVLLGEIDWEATSNGTAANSSTVKAIIYARRTDNYETTGRSWGGYVKIEWNNGITSGSATEPIEFDYSLTVDGDWTEMAVLSGVTVPHRNDGTMSVKISGEVSGPSGTTLAGRTSTSKESEENVNLDTIPRYTSITSFTVAKRNETSVTYSFTTADICDYAYYSTNDGSSWTGVDITDGKSASFNVTGLSPNTTYNFKLKVRRKDSGLETISSRVQQTTYKAPTQSLSSKTETSITMNWNIDSTADYIWYSKDNGNNWTAVGSVNATSGSYTISGLTANTAYNIKTRVRRKASQTTYDTAASSQTTYNYPYVSAVGSNPLTIGNSQTLTLYNPLSRSVTVRMYQNSASGTQLYSGTTNSTSITFTPTASTLYASIPNSTSGNCVYSVIYGSSTKTTGTNTYKIIGNETPTFSNFTYADTNSTTTALTGNNQIIVNGYSNVTATISTANKAVAKNSATMNNYTLSIGSQSAQANYSESSDVSMSLTKVNSGVIKVTANDSRGLGTPVTKNATIKNYVKPATTNLTATRSNNGVGETVTLSFAGTWWNDSFGSVANSIQNIAYYFKKSTASAWTTGTTTITFSTSGNNFSGSLAVAGDTSSQGFAAADSYYIKIVVTDRLDHSVEFQTTIGSGTPAIAIYKDNVAIGQQYDTNGGGKLQVNGDIKAKFYTPLFYNLDLSSLSTSNFYPITFPKGEADIPLDCEIHSPNVSGSSAYNQNVIHFRIITNGWNDTPPLFNIFEYGVFATNEITIGCIGRSTERIGTEKEGECIWLRGGLNYRFVSNFKPVLHTSNYSPDTNVTYSVGTNYYGGTNTSVSILFTPNSTLTGNGGYFSGKAKSSDTASTATKATQDSDGNQINSTYVKKTGLVSSNVTATVANTTTDSGWSMIDSAYTGNNGFILRSIRFNQNAPNWGVGNFGSGICFGGADTKGLLSVKYDTPSIKLAGGNGKPIKWWIGLTGTSGRTYDLNVAARVNLYNNTTGSNGTITLSESAANFSYIEVFYSKYEGNLSYSVHGSMKIYAPNGKRGVNSFFFQYTQNNQSQLINRTIYFNGTSLTQSYGGVINFVNSSLAAQAQDNKEIYINRVDGYR